MTTTGAARYHKILNDIGPKIVIVEEAAEIFESHIASALSKHCQHLILIGDHVQLRPKPNVYKLEKEYRLDVSLFERLLNNNVEHVMLKCQHRMRPEISVLMNHFYRDQIENHESVHGRPDVMGTKANMFFIDHAWAEESVSDGHSKSNKHEAAYLIQLCKYLLKQEYIDDQITILTTYLGQMFEIKSAMRNAKLKNIRVSTVDNYQGEECDIILLSLVRSNNNGKIGFLAIENRICVALSRARLGMSSVLFVCALRDVPRDTFVSHFVLFQ
jgi:superfamily I DNA and/or RNA helicase